MEALYREMIALETPEAKLYKAMDKLEAIDPWGTVYKFADYVAILHLESLSPLVTFGAFALPVAETLLGVFILFGLYRRFAPIMLTALMAVMTVLTFYLAVTDRMADCGCFGDVLVHNFLHFHSNVSLKGYMFL